MRLGPGLGCPAGRSSYSSVNASTADVTTRAFSASIVPAASARRVAPNRSSSFSARCRSRNAAVLVVFVSCASHAGVEVAPESAPTWLRSAATSTRSRSSTSRASARASSTNASRCSAGLIDHVGISVSRSNAECSDPANRTTACPGRAPPTSGGVGGTNVKDMPPR